MIEKNFLEIDDLPEEVLQYILSFLDIGSSRKAALTCRKFYELICHLQRDKFVVGIDCTELSKNDDLISSMINSMRTFNEMRINWNNSKFFDISWLLKVVHKFGLNLKKLTIFNYIDHQHFNPHALISILENLPNIEVLEISGSHLTKIKSQAETPKRFTRLNRLKKLSLVNCTTEVEAILNSIPDNVLEEFNYHDYFYRFNEIFFQNFIDRQSNIKKLKILNCENIKLDHLELKELSIDPSHSSFPNICSQEKLRVLTYKGKVTDSDLTTLTQLCNLAEITIDITEVTASGVLALKKLDGLKSLKILNFCTDSTSALGVLERLQLSRLEKLSLEVSPLITKQDVIKMNHNFSSLKHLEIYDSNALTLQEVFRSFSQIEKVSFHRMKNSWFSFGAGHQNLKEIELSHVGSCSAATWKSELNFLTRCPMLEKISVSEVCNFQEQDLTVLVESLPNLSHLALAFKNLYMDCNGKAVKNAIPQDFSFFKIILKHFQMSAKLIYLEFSQLAMLPNVEQLQCDASLAYPSIKISIDNKFKQFLLQKRISRSISN